jgi:anti-anti-sigma factor
LDGLSTTVTVPDSDTVAITLLGDLDFATRDRLRSAVQDVLAQYAPKVVVVDLAGIKTLDSSGVGALVHAWKTAQTAGCHLVVRNPTRLAYWQLELTGLLEIFGSPQQPG